MCGIHRVSIRDTASARIVEEPPLSFIALECAHGVRTPQSSFEWLFDLKLSRECGKGVNRIHLVGKCSEACGRNFPNAPRRAKVSEKTLFALVVQEQVIRFDSHVSQIGNGPGFHASRVRNPG